jgi:hypothetical protein
MEPLLAEGEVSRSSYALLYDRIMLKITGRQRYGSQVMCREGRLVTMPTESDEMVGVRRREMELGPLADYLARAAQAMGQCS